MVEGGDGVGEGRQLGVVDDGGDLGLLPRTPPRKPEEMLVPDAVEGRDVERRSVGLEEGIPGLSAAAGAGKTPPSPDRYRGARGRSGSVHAVRTSWKDGRGPYYTQGGKGGNTPAVSILPWEPVWPVLLCLEEFPLGVRLPGFEGDPPRPVRTIGVPGITPAPIE